jgi:hypothetical protein
MRDKSDVFRSDTRALTNSIGFSLLGPRLDDDVRIALKTALESKAIFPKGNRPIAIFREALAASIRDIESHPRGKLFQKFLLMGPYEDTGEVPPEFMTKRLSDEETASAITFIYSHMVNSFKGAVTEFLAAGACTRLLRQLQINGELPADSRLYIGDAVTVRQKSKSGLLKGADLHILVEDFSGSTSPIITVAGLVEAKSYFQSQKKLDAQLHKHQKRMKNGLNVTSREYPSDRIRVGFGPKHRLLKIAVLPADWLLPRTFHYNKSQNGSMLHMDATKPPFQDDTFAWISNDKWRIILRWSKEALAEAAYEMTFWYMSKVGEVIFSQGVPSYWKEMGPAEAGRNAVKSALYYAMLRCRTEKEDQRAIALYNSYGFGYALGMNFRNTEGKREMLWPQDLDEIMVSGKTKTGSRIWE